MKNLSIQEMVQIAKEGNFENWLNPESTGRGWYTCILTNKKFRGDQAMEMLKAQEDYLIELEADNSVPVGEADVEEIIEMIEEIKEKETPVVKASAPVIWNDVAVGGQEIKAMRTENLDTHIAIETQIKKKPVKTTIIYCCDCGAPREIKVQDQFQVKRCPICQKAYRNLKRRESRKAKKNNSKV